MKNKQHFIPESTRPVDKTTAIVQEKGLVKAYRGQLRAACRPDRGNSVAGRYV